MATSGTLIGPDWRLKVPGGLSSPWRLSAPPPGQTARCLSSARNSEAKGEANDWRVSIIIIIFIMFGVRW